METTLVHPHPTILFPIAATDLQPYVERMLGRGSVAAESVDCWVRGVGWAR